MAFAMLVSAGALVKASPIIQQKGDTFRALLIILSKQSGQSRRATVAEEDASETRQFPGRSSTTKKQQMSYCIPCR